MMRKTIVRTMSMSKINACKLEMVDGQPRAEMLEPLTVMGKATEKDAIKALKEKYGKNAPVAVSSIEVEENTYEISVEDFLKHAKKIEKTENEEKEGNE